MLRNVLKNIAIISYDALSLVAFNWLVLVISLFSSRFLHLSLVSPGSNCGRTWLVRKGWCLSQGLGLRHVTREKKSHWLSIILGWCYIVAMRSRRRFSFYVAPVSSGFPWVPSLWTVTSGFSWIHVFVQHMWISLNFHVMGHYGRR